MNKLKLLKSTINGIFDNNEIIDAEIGKLDENEYYVWTYEKYKKNKLIYCHYVIWKEEMMDWFDKSISEIEGPSLLNCPIRFFNYEVSKEFPQWRYEVKKYHEQIGDIVQNEIVANKLIKSLENEQNA